MKELFCFLSHNKIMSLSILIPAKNEKDNLPIVLDKIISFLNFGLDYEIVVIKADNDDSDRNLNIKEFNNLDYSTKNPGYGAALKKDLQQLLKNICVFLMQMVRSMLKILRNFMTRRMMEMTLFIVQDIEKMLVQKMTVLLHS